jgi:tetratricopeptide (TPR) repeat protein
MSSKEKSNYALDACYDMIKQKKYSEAVECCNYVIELQPNNAIAYNDRGFAYYKMQKNNEAIINFTKAIIINPNFIDAYRNRGNVNYDLSRYDEAINDWEKSIQLDSRLEKELRTKIDEAKSKK